MNKCTFPGCDRSLASRGLCSGHYAQMAKGKTLTPIKTHLFGSASEKLDFYSEYDAAGCKVWTGTKSHNGYGTIRVRNVLRRAHRVAYELAHGEIPADQVIDHTCHNRACINVDHLQAVTAKQNSENFAGLSKANTSGVRGVHWSKQANRWQARVTHHGVIHMVGSFASLREAADAVLRARLELHTNNLLDRAG